MKSQLSLIENLKIIKVIQVQDYYQLLFEKNFSMNILNDYMVKEVNSIEDLKNLRVTSTENNERLVKINFENNISLTVDLNDNAYHGPEAIVLYGPNNKIVVWN